MILAVFYLVVFIPGFDLDSSKGADSHLRLQGTRESGVSSVTYFGALYPYVVISFADYALISRRSGGNHQGQRYPLGLRCYTSTSCILH